MTSRALSTMFIVSLLSLVGCQTTKQSSSNRMLQERISRSDKLLTFSRFEPQDYNHGWGYSGLGLGGASYYESCKEKAKKVPGDLWDLSYQVDGLRVKGVLLTPEGFDPQKRYPVVIYNRGGNREFGAFTVCKKERLAEMFSKHGFVVAIPQLRGVAGGDGQEEWGGKEINDILALEDILLASGIVKPSQLFMVGWSRGAMSTMLAIKAGSKVNAAVAIAGVSETFSSLAQRPDMEMMVARQLIPNYDQNKYQLLRDRSAFFWPESLINTPLLLLHGTNDWRVSHIHAEKLVLTLRDIHPNFKSVFYEGDDHGLTKNKDKAYNEIRNWLLSENKATEKKQTKNHPAIPGWFKQLSDMKPVRIQPKKTIELIQSEIRKIWQDANGKEEYRTASMNLSRLLNKYPHSFRLQKFYASILGDSIGELAPHLRGKAQKASIEIMEKVLGETEGQPAGSVYSLRNEYYWQTAQHLQQFKLGQERVKATKSGHYSIIVGGAWYAHQLYGFGRVDLAREYLSDVKKAWPLFRSYNKTNNNIFVHYALALGLLGELREMNRMLDQYCKRTGVDPGSPWMMEIRELIDEHMKKGRILREIDSNG